MAPIRVFHPKIASHYGAPSKRVIQISRDDMLPSMELARHLDREADVELSQGHHAAAERLAWRAAELRGSGA